MKTLIAALTASLSLTLTAPTQAADADPGREAFREIYKEMVEIDSSQSTGSCTKVVRAAQTRLKAAGFADDDVQVVIPEGKPEDGNIVARIHAKDPAKKGVLLLAHIDVVDAQARGLGARSVQAGRGGRLLLRARLADDKSMAATGSTLLIRLQAGALQAARTVKMALTCGEETANRVQRRRVPRQEPARPDRRRVRAQRRRGRACVDADGKPLMLRVQAGEKIHQELRARSDQPGRSQLASRARTTRSISWQAR